MAQLRTFEGITREKGHSPSLLFALARLSSCASVPVPVPSSPSRSLGRYHYFTVGWLPKIRDEGGRRAQTERISPLVRDLQNFSFLSRYALQSLRFAVKSIGYENSCNMRAPRAVSAAFFHGCSMRQSSNCDMCDPFLHAD